MDEPRRKRILVVTRNMPPLVGGMERLNWHMAGELAKVADVRVVGPVGSARLAPGGIEIDEVALDPLPRFLLAAQWRAWRRARSASPPHLVLAGSGLTAPMALFAARACNAHCVTYVHGLDIAVPNRVYRRFWLPAMRRMDRVIANSHMTATLAMEAGIDPARIGVVHPGVDIPDAYPDTYAASRFREENGLGNRPMLLSVGRLSSRKGLREFVVEVLPRIARIKPDVILVIVGDAPNQALHAQAQTRESIQAAAASVGLGDNLKFLGVISNRELALAYRASNVHVFPVRQIPGDPEGFGMVAIEAAAHALPTVAYAVGGVVDAVAEGISGHLAQAGDGAAFAACVLGLLDQRLSEEPLRAFAGRFSWEKFGAAIHNELELASDARTIA